MNKLPLILEGKGKIVFQAGETQLKTVNSTVTVGRGRMVCALPIFWNFDGNPTARLFSLSFGGQSIWQDSGMQLYNLQFGFNTGKLKYVPLNYGEGQTFSFNVKLLDIRELHIAAPLACNVLFMYEGFHMTRDFTRNIEQHYIGFYSEFEGENTEKINDILPKNRGSIVGFRIQVETTSINFGPVDQESFINLNISGIEIIKDVPIEYFNSYSTAVHEFYFDEPIEGGAPFELRMVSEDISINHGNFGIDWIFDEPENVV